MQDQASLRRSRGFTLIELLIVVAIIGIIAVIAVPNLITALDRAKQKATMADIQQLAKALESYMLENGDYPELKDVAGLARLLEPKYLRDAPEQDRWKHPYVVIADARSYTICSNGKDGVGSCESEAVGVTSDFDDPITYTNGAFVSRPEGAQDQ